MTLSSLRKIAAILTGGSAMIASAASAQKANSETVSPRAERTSADNYLQLGVGLDYSEGTYGDTRATRITVVPVSAKFVTGPFALRVAIPYIFLSGPGSVIDTGAGGGSVQGGGTSRSVRGFGDATVSATYTIELKRNDLFLDVSGKIKIPTGSTDKLLGTGLTDVTPSASLTKVAGPITFYVQGRRRFAGRSINFPVRDVWGAAGGVVVRASKAVRLGIDYDWQQSSYRLRPPISALTGSATIRLSKALRLQVYGDVGLTSNSLAQGGGVQLLWRIGH